MISRARTLIVVSVVTVVCLASIGIAVWWESLPEKPQSSEGDLKEDALVGLSTEVGSPDSGDTRNNVFWSSPGAAGGLKQDLVPVYNSSLLRSRVGFVTPDDGALTVMDTQLHVTSQIPVDDLGVGTLSESDSSENNAFSAFSFNEGNAQRGEPDARRIVVTDGVRAVSLHRSRLVQALTVCDDGSAKWLEYSPKSNSDPLGVGTASVVSRTQDGEIDEFKINEMFAVAPSSESSLPCGDTKAFVDYRSVSGDREVLHISLEKGLAITKDKLPLPSFPQSGGSRFTHSVGSTLYSLNEDGELTKVDLERSNLIYSKKVAPPGPDVLSVTFDGQKAYIVVRPDALDNQQSVIQVDLNEPSCVSDPIQLIGFDTLSEKSKITRGDSSYMATLSVLPVQKNHSYSACG